MYFLNSYRLRTHVSINAKIGTGNVFLKFHFSKGRKFFLDSFCTTKMLSSEKIYKKGRIELGQAHGQSMRSTLYYKAGAM
jgi:hypothetical protein